MDEQFNKELKVFLVTIAQKYGCDFRGSIEGCLNTIQLLEHEQELIITVIKNYELKDRLVDQIYEYFIKNYINVERPIYEPVGKLFISYKIKWHN